MDRDDTCNACLDGATCDAEGTSLRTLVIKRGHYRFDNTSIHIHKCTKAGDHACKGGKGAGEQLCATGYTSALCSRCESNFYRREADDTCTECSAQAFFEPSLQAILATLIVLALAFLFCLAELKILYERTHWDKLRVGYINYSILRSIPDALDVKYPEPARTFFAIVDSFALNPFDLISGECINANLARFDARVVATTVCVFVACVLNWLIFGIRCLVFSNAEQRQRALSQHAW